MRPNKSLHGPTGRFVALISLLFAPLLFSAEPTWDELRNSSFEYLYEQNDLLEDRYDISNHERWDFSQDTGLLVFSNGGVPAVEADVLFVGSYSRVSNTWLWGWSNSSVDEQLSHPILAVRDFGIKMGFDQLSNERWPGDEYDAWEMAAISNYILGGKGIYRPPGDRGVSFLLITEIRRTSAQ